MNKFIISFFSLAGILLLNPSEAKAGVCPGTLASDYSHAAKCCGYVSKTSYEYKIMVASCTSTISSTSRIAAGCESYISSNPPPTPTPASIQCCIDKNVTTACNWLNSIIPLYPYLGTTTPCGVSNQLFSYSNGGNYNCPPY